MQRIRECRMINLQLDIYTTLATLKAWDPLWRRKRKKEYTANVSV